MRIAVGGFMHESNTFAPQPTDLERFREGSLTYGAAMIPVWRDAHHEVGGFIEGATKFGFDLVPLGDGLGHALRAGHRRVLRALLRRARHRRAGSRSRTACCSHCTARWSRRSTPPPTPRCCAACAPRSGRTCRSRATLDFHGNVSPAMADYANILVGYQTYPHVDQRERGLLAAELLTRTVQGRDSPGDATSPSRR